MPKKIPMRRKLNGKHNGVDSEDGLTPAQLCDYAGEQGVAITTNTLALLRRDRKGPPYLLINGRWIRYTRRAADTLIEGRKTRLVNPASKAVEAF